MTVVLIESNPQVPNPVLQPEIEDTEVEDILNEIGFANDAMSVVENPDTAPASSSIPSNSFAPVSPDHKDSSSSSDDYAMNASMSAVPHVLIPSISVENLTTFSVPNPMANMPPSFTNQQAPATAKTDFVTAESAVAQLSANFKKAEKEHVAVEKAAKNSKRKRKPSLPPATTEPKDFSEDQVEERRYVALVYVFQKLIL